MISEVISVYWTSAVDLAPSFRFRGAVMISIEQWRARIGLFNCKNKGVRTATPSSVILCPLFLNSVIHITSQGHYSSKLMTNKPASSTSHSSTRTSSTGPAPKQTHEAASSTLPASLSRCSGLFSVHRSSVFKSVLIISIIIAVISQLLIISGNVETNPGPKRNGELLHVAVHYQSVVCL